MPILKIFTNVPRSKIPRDFLKKIIPVLVEGVKKEANLFVVSVEADSLLTINADPTLPAAVATLESIGHLGPEENKIIAKLLTDFLQKELGVPPERVSEAGNMPILKIFTNVSRSKFPRDFLTKIIPVLVEGVKKEAETFAVVVEADSLLTINANPTLPAAVATLESIGHLGPEENKIIAKLLTDFLQEELGVPPER